MRTSSPGDFLKPGMPVWRGKQLVIFILPHMILLYSTVIFAQSRDLSGIKISLVFKNEPLSEVLKDIIDKTELSIVFSDKIVNDFNITGNFKKTDIISILNKILGDNSLFYTINENNQITVYKQKYPSLKYTIITGKITDEKGNPLELANVYVANTLIGSYTDIDGLYSIKNIPTGSHTLVVSMAGYEPVQKELRFTEPVLDKMHFRLKEKTEMQAEIIVTAESPKRRMKYLDMFEKAFIGESWNARDTEILNPDALEFNFDDKKNTLTVSAKEPLAIRNGSLGYLIRYELTGFILTDKNTVYRGFPSFEELTPENSKQLKYWIENRKRTYEASIKCFLYSLVNRKVRKNGFKLKQAKIDEFISYDKQVKFDQRYMNPTTYGSIRRRKMMKEYYKGQENEYKTLQISISHGELENERFILFEDYLRIQYLNKDQISYLGLVNGKTKIDKNGWLYDPFSVVIAGKWSEYRVADLLPYEYNPEDK